MNIDAYPPTRQVFFNTAREQLTALDPQNVCDRTGALYDADTGRYITDFLGSKATIDRNTAAMEWPHPVEYVFHILLLHYLIHADGSRPTGEWISLREAAPNASTRLNQMQAANIPPLIEVFAGDIGLLYSSAEKLGGQKSGDCSVQFSIFPHVPVQVTVWPKDDEFPADARLLFDKTLLRQLTPEDIVYVPDLAVRSLVRESGKTYPFLPV